jgi:hypothetical protein
MLLPGAPSPMEIDPFALYADYPTAPILPQTRVEPGRVADAAEIARHDRLSGRDLYRRRLMAVEDALAVQAEVIRSGGATVEDIARVMGRRVDFVLTAVAYLAKADLVRLPVIGPRG